MADDVTILESFRSADTLRGDESARSGEIADGLMAEAETGEKARQIISDAIADLQKD